MEVLEKSIQETFDVNGLKIELSDNSESFIPGYTSYIDEVYKIRKKTKSLLKDISIESHTIRYIGEMVDEKDEHQKNAVVIEFVNDDICLLKSLNTENGRIDLILDISEDYKKKTFKEFKEWKN